jgi:hypothetical protein
MPHHLRNGLRGWEFLNPEMQATKARHINSKLDVLFSTGDCPLLLTGLRGQSGNSWGEIIRN